MWAECQNPIETFDKSRESGTSNSQCSEFAVGEYVSCVLSCYYFESYYGVRLLGITRLGREDSPCAIFTFEGLKFQTLNIQCIVHTLLPSVCFIAFHHLQIQGDSVQLIAWPFVGSHPKNQRNRVGILVKKFSFRRNLLKICSFLISFRTFQSEVFQVRKLNFSKIVGDIVLFRSIWVNSLLQRLNEGIEC